jgi:hypothetical protein
MLRLGPPFLASGGATLHRQGKPAAAYGGLHPALAGKQLSRLLYYTPVVRLLQKPPYGGRMRVLLALGYPSLMKKWGSHVRPPGL